jgi:predicted AAA+ superfamily ATPase
VIPVQAAEIAKVLAKRLFTDIDQQAARETAEAYMAMYCKSAAVLPDRASQEDFREVVVAHYPFHPTFIEFLNRKLATVETFQGTRGVLRVLALAIRSLWREKLISR